MFSNPFHIPQLSVEWWDTLPLFVRMSCLELEQPSQAHKDL